jgi:hypothetical protein
MRAALALLIASGCHLPIKTACRENSDCNPRQVCVAAVCVASGGDAGSTPAPDARVIGWTGEPVLLVSDQAAPRGIVVDDAAIYWTSDWNGTVSRKSLVTGELTVIAGGQLRPVGIAIDSERVYWTNQLGGDVRSAPLRGGTISTIAAEQAALDAIAVDAGHLYWTSGGSLMVASKTGGLPTLLIAEQLDAVKLTPVKLTLDDERVYWTSFDGNVWSVGKGGGLPVLLTPEPAPMFGITVDADTVYWTSLYVPGEWRVMKTARDGSATPVVVAESLHGANNIVVDANHLYVALTVDRMILRLSKDGGENTVLVTDRGEPAGLAIDATNVYWWTLDGRIMKVSK